jgi:hypothetical protein
VSASSKAELRLPILFVEPPVWRNSLRHCQYLGGVHCAVVNIFEHSKQRITTFWAGNDHWAIGNRLQMWP